jgi:arsenite-transporting ATPase
VGKTSCAAAAALAAAEAGRRVLAVSTDPAHSLGDALAARLSSRARRLTTRKGALWAAELDADRALARWLDSRRAPLQSIAERGTYLDQEDVERFLRLSFPGVDELVGLLELDRLAAERRYDEVVVDTAPTGHTLRLLATPETLRRIAAVLDDMQAKHRYLALSLRRGYVPDAEDALVAELERHGAELAEGLRGGRARFTWLTLPERLSVAEAIDGIRELDAAGIAVDELVVNRVAPPPARGCRLCAGRARAEATAIRSLRAGAGVPRVRQVPDLGGEPRGVAALRRLARALERGAPRRPAAAGGARPGPRSARPARPRGDAAEWLESVAPAGTRLLVFCGKGGVGKTTCAAACGLMLSAASRGRVLLLSVDPAHSLGDALGTPLDDEERPVRGAPASLRARELDAPRALRLRREQYLERIGELFEGLRGGSRFDVAFDRAVLEDLIELAPPGIDELFGMLGLVDALLAPGAAGEPRHDVVVLDTAPTGHALRLLALPETALQWIHALLATLLKYREALGLGDLASDLLEIARRLRALQALVRDPRQARFVLVTRAAELPWLEAERLRTGLDGLGVPAPAVLVNALTPPGCRRCARASAAERAVLRRIRRSAASASPALLAATATAPPPVGVAALRRWSGTWERIGT